jgi:hypothetical protein
MSTPPHEAELEELIAKLYSWARDYESISEGQYKAAINAYCYKQVMELIGPIPDDYYKSGYSNTTVAKYSALDKLRQAAAERFGQIENLCSI